MRWFHSYISALTLYASLCGAQPVYKSESEALYNVLPYNDPWGYRKCCEDAVNDDSLFAEFKRAVPYIHILEHLGTCTGIPYLAIIKEQTPEFLDAIEIFKRNDLIGHPRTNYYPETGEISTTTIRYMKVASDLTKIFGSLDQKSIIEIGGGYGGQCLTLSHLYKFKSYTIIDLPEPIALTRKYLARHNISNVICKSFDEAIDEQNFDLVISNYAYCELSHEMKQKYLRDVLSRSKRGYITGEGFHEEAAEYLKPYGATCEILPEIPLTNPNNVLMIWGR